MPPTIIDENNNKCDNAEPSAPPLSETDIPVVTAYAINDLPAVAPTANTSLSLNEAASFPPRSGPPGMVTKTTTTTTYSDGRKVTVTEHQYPMTNKASISATPSPANTISITPHRNLGSAPVTFTCPFCSHVGPTRTRSVCGDCTWISVIILLLICFPLFWVPLVCNSVSIIATFFIHCIIDVNSITYIMLISARILNITVDSAGESSANLRPNVVK